MTTVPDASMRPLGRVRPGFAPAPEVTRPRPHAAYKAEFLDRILALAPSSVLDIGAGEGALLSTLQARGVARCVGLEVDRAQASELEARGVEAAVGFAEALPFENAAFDVVVLQYAAHHLADLQRGLREAARVARRAVLVLDPWYDVSLASQRVSLAYDLWCKAIDRRVGMIHNACPSVGELAAPFVEQGGYRIEAAHRLILQMLDVKTVSAEAARHLARLTPQDPQIAAALEEILADARRKGMSDDGAVLFCATAE